MEYRILKPLDQQAIVTNKITQIEKHYYECSIEREKAIAEGNTIGVENLEAAMAKDLAKRDFYSKELDKVNAVLTESRRLAKIKREQHNLETQQAAANKAYELKRQTFEPCQCANCKCEDLRTDGGLVTKAQESEKDLATELIALFKTFKKILP